MTLSSISPALKGKVSKIWAKILVYK